MKRFAKNRDLPVVTTLNQCLLRSDVTISTNNKKSVLNKGEKEYQNVDWIYQDKVGYIFPEPSAVNIKNSEASGSWWRINMQTDSPKDEIELDVFKAWINHGIRPSDKSYEYIVVPATSIEKLEQNKSKESIKILSNTPEVQAVVNSDIRMCQAVFYEMAEIQIMENLTLCCQTPGIVIIQALPDDGAKLTVSDPNRESGKMLLTVSVKIEKRGDNFKAVWNEKEKVSEITIDLPDGHYAGSSVTIDL